MARVIAIANHKGGSGKTTVAVNLSAALANKEQKVLLIDIDPQANATLCLGINSDTNKHSIYEAFLNNIPLDNIIQPTKVKNLTIIPSNIELVGAEIELVNRPFPTQILKQKLYPIKHIYDFIIIDSQPSLGILTLNALIAATEVIIPIQTHPLALKGVDKLIYTINEIKKNYHHTLKIKVLPTMYDARTTISKLVADQIRQIFNGYVFNITLYIDTKVTEMPLYGLPIMYYAKYSRASLQYQLLANEVMKGE